jgi:hypothetical protein
MSEGAYLFIADSDPRKELPLAFGQNAYGYPAPGLFRKKTLDMYALFDNPVTFFHVVK